MSKKKNFILMIILFVVVVVGIFFSTNLVKDNITVTFIDNNKLISEAKIKIGKLSEFPKTPKKNLQLFIGWFNGDKEVTAPTVFITITIIIQADSKRFIRFQNDLFLL